MNQLLMNRGRLKVTLAYCAVQKISQNISHTETTKQQQNHTNKPPPVFVGVQFLTTVIPYQRNRGPPSLEDLQVLTRSRSYCC